MRPWKHLKFVLSANWLGVMTAECQLRQHSRFDLKRRFGREATLLTKDGTDSRQPDLTEAVRLKDGKTDMNNNQTHEP